MIESVAPQAKICREEMEAEFQNTVSSGNVLMEKDEDQNLSVSKGVCGMRQNYI